MAAALFKNLLSEGFKPDKYIAEAKTNITSHPGSKNSSGSFHQIINEIPPIKKFTCLFLGNCPVFDYFSDKIECEGYELDKKVIVKYWLNKDLNSNVTIHADDVLVKIVAHDDAFMNEEFIYADPPYPGFIRKSQKKLYSSEMLSKSPHRIFLNRMLAVPGRVAISSYENELYDNMLSGWRKKKWQVQTRSGTAIECLYMNYDVPADLYTYDYLGSNSLERQRIKRKISRHIDKLSKLHIHERKAILRSFKDVFNYEIPQV